MRRNAARVLLAVLVVAIALFALAVRKGVLSLAPWTSPGGATSPPNIVMIVMDTARQDRLSCYGYARETSPRLRELAEESTVFDRAYSTSSWTNPAHASLFTGLYPAAHGVTQEHWKMSQDLVTLAEVLSEHGYETTGIIENSMLSSEYGFQQGFSAYHLTSRIQKMLDRAEFNGRSETGNHATDLFLKSLRGMAPGRPFFIFVNLIAPHQPYDSSKQFMHEFVTNRDMSLVSNMWPEYYLGQRKFTPAELRHLNELYDAELLFTDHLVGKMMDGLRSQGHWDNTVFIVTSDHGENIGDHGHMDHVFSLYETTVKIPLIIHNPPRFRQGVLDHSPVTLADLFPTVLDAAGVESSGYPCQGLSLLSERPPEDRAIISEYYWPVQALGRYSTEDRTSRHLDAHKRRIRSITVGSRKLVWGGDGKHELFDLDEDPEELVNLLDSEDGGDELRALEKRLAELVSSLESERKVVPVSVRTEELDEDTREALRSLGYLQ